MSLTDEEKKRIEEDEYRKHTKAQLSKKLSIDADIKSDQRIETHGVGREIYHDSKYVAKKAGKAVGEMITLLVLLGLTFICGGLTYVWVVDFEASLFHISLLIPLIFAWALLIRWIIKLQ